MSLQTRDIVFLLLQSIDEKKYKKTVHTLEQESGLFFNISYFKELWVNGDWDKVEKYLSGFTKVGDNKHSTKIFYEIQKLKYFEALYRKDDAKAFDTLKKDLRVFAVVKPDVYKDMTQLLMWDDFRQNEQLSEFQDPKHARRKVFDNIELVIQSNPLLHDKLKIPIVNSGLWTQVNQRMNWEHPFLENPKPISDIGIPLVNPSGMQLQPIGVQPLFSVANPKPIADTGIPLVNPSGMQLQPIGVQPVFSVANPLRGAVPKPGDFLSLGVGGPAQAPLPASLGERANSTSFVPQSSSSSAKPTDFSAFSSSAEPTGFIPFSSSALSIGFKTLNTEAAIFEHPGVPPTKNSAIVNQTDDSQHVLNGQTPFRIPDQYNIIQSSADDECRIADNSIGNSKIWKLTKISKPSQCRSLRLPDKFEAARVSRLRYTKFGVSILALAANALHKLWIWPRNSENITGKATASVVPQQWEPSSGISMTNDISGTRPQDAIPCLALSHNGAYVLSASGGAISLYELTSFATMAKLAHPPPIPTYIADNPEDINVIAVGMEDSSIKLFYTRSAEIKTMAKGHKERITGLAFSNALKVLVSSGADSRLCVWSADGERKLKTKCLQFPAWRATYPHTDTYIEFHQDQTRLLVVHASQIAIYRAPMLELLSQFIRPRDSAPLIAHATYSCDSKSIYVALDDGRIWILTASASPKLRCIINPASYLPANPRVHPLVIAAHPSKPNQFALGLSDGGVCVLEPLVSQGKWGTDPPLQDGARP